MTAVRCVEGNVVAEPGRAELRLGAGLERARVAGDGVSDDAGGERDDVADMLVSSRHSMPSVTPPG